MEIKEVLAVNGVPIVFYAKFDQNDLAELAKVLTEAVNYMRGTNTTTQIMVSVVEPDKIHNLNNLSLEQILANRTRNMLKSINYKGWGAEREVFMVEGDIADEKGCIYSLTIRKTE